MTSTNDPYQFSMDNSISETPCTRSSSRNRKVQNKRIENVSKSDKQQRPITRSSQKPTDDENDNSFMSNISSGFSQFVNPKKRERDDKKTKTFKRPKITTYSDENQPPDAEIQAIEQVKLIYETAGGRTNLARAAATNAKILANRTTSNTTYNLNIIDDTQTETLVIPDTLANHDTQHNDSSWQRDIDRLMKKLEEPSICVKSQTQTNEQEEIIESICSSQTEKTPQQSIQTSIKKTPITTIIQKDEIGIQTENTPNSSTTHDCCQDVSTCPCVLRYSKLERLFMEKISRFINIVPAIPNTTIIPDNHQRRRTIPTYSRFRRFRGHRRTNQRIVKSSIENNESTTDETITEVENQIEENVEINQEQNESINSTENVISTTTAIEKNIEINQEQNASINSTENVISTTIAIENNVESIDDLSSIEKLDTTTVIDHTSTLLISSADNTCLTNRHLVLTTSSLDENQKSQFRLFLTRFNASISSTVDSTTTHIIVNDSSPLVCPLTGKIIQGIARHLFIVSSRWINECLSQESIIDERPFEIRGDTSLGSDHGGMRRSRLTPSYLLEKYSICLRCSSNDCAPLQTIEQVYELIELCGGKIVKNFSEIKTMDNQRQMILVLGVQGFSGGEKKRKAILDTCQQFNVRCVNIHWLLISIAKFDIQPFENYDINQM